MMKGQSVRWGVCFAVAAVGLHWVWNGLYLADVGLRWIWYRTVEPGFLFTYIGVAGSMTAVVISATRLVAMVVPMARPITKAALAVPVVFAGLVGLALIFAGLLDLPGAREAYFLYTAFCIPYAIFGALYLHWRKDFLSKPLARGHGVLIAGRTWILVATIVIVVVPLFIVGCLQLFGPDRIVWFREIQAGDALARKVDSYRQAYRRLPVSVMELGVSEQDHPQLFYEMCSDSHYVISFAIGLGKSMSYDSDTRQWKPINVPCL
jgi:hypothetical protein